MTVSDIAAGTAGTAGTDSGHSAGEKVREGLPNLEGGRGTCGTTRSTRSTRNPADVVTWLESLLGALGSAKQGRKWQCPVHGLTGEHSTALAVGARDDEAGAWIHCHAGCGLDDILKALHLTRPDLSSPPPVAPARHAKAWKLAREFPPPKVEHGSGGGSGGWVAVSIDEHAYGDPDPIAWKVRERNRAGVKRMHWESLNPAGERVPGLLGRRESDLPLYLVRQVRMAVAMGELIVVCESESSVDALVKVGVYATTWAGGASSPPLARLRAELAHANVLLVPDHDDAGRDCAERIVGALPNARVQLGDPGEDARDILARVGASWFR